MRISLLKPYKPLKQKPDVLIYNPPGTLIYRIITTSIPQAVGEMIAFPEQKSGDKYLWISHLFIFQKRHGYGTKFLNFARNLSHNMGCNGKLRLTAATTVYDPITPPHEFYRKYGFGTDQKKTLRKIDRAIMHNKPLSYKTTPPIEMFYPDNTKKSLLQKILTKLYL